jgi:hypothetical protein
MIRAERTLESGGKGEASSCGMTPKSPRALTRARSSTRSMMRHRF